MRGAAAAVLALVAIQAAGWLRPADERVAGWAMSLRTPPSRATAPLLLAVDDRAVERWGAPPWPAATWVTIAEDLRRRQIDEVWWVDPWPRLARVEGPHRAEALIFQVPRVLLPGPDGGTVVVDPPAVTGPWRARAEQLFLPHTPGLGLRDWAGADAQGWFGPSVLCVLAECPPPGGTANWPIVAMGGPGALPTLSLPDVVDGEGPFPEAQRTLLIGLTAPAFADPVSFGTPSRWLWRAEAVGQGLASARSSRPVPRLPTSVDAALVALAGLAGLLVTNVSRGRPGGAAAPLLFPAFVAFVAAGMVLGGVWMAPVTALGLAAAVSPVWSAVASRGVAIDFLQRVALLVAHDGFRYAWRDTRVRNPDELLARLGALTRNHTTTERMGLLLAVPGGTALRWAGGYGVSEADIDPGRLRQDLRPFADARTRPEGALADDLVADGRVGRVLPLWQDRAFVGYWLVVWGRGAAPADPATLARLARWMNLRIAMVDARPATGWRDLLTDALDAQASSVHRLFLAASEERRRQIQALNAVELPLLTADVAGSIQFVNRTMGDRIAANGIQGVETLRGLLFQLMGAEGFHDTMKRLFVANERVVLRWTARDRSTWRVVVEPVREESTVRAEVLGYVLHLVDESHREQLRAVNESILRFANTRVRNGLQVILGYSQLLRDVGNDRDVRDMLDVVIANAREVEAAMASLQLQGGGEEQDVPVALDLVHLLEDLVDDVAPAMSQRRVEVSRKLPAVSLPVRAPAGRTRQALAGLLNEAAAGASSGGRLAVELVERPAVSEVILRWDGPGFDPQLAQRLGDGWNGDLGTLPRELHAFGRARTACAGFSWRSNPGEGVTVACQFTRDGGAGC